MLKLLVHTDFSRNAKNALRYAIKIANLTPSKLYLIHVFRPITRADTVLSITERIKEQANEKLEKLIRSVQQMCTENCQIEAKVRTGDRAIAVARSAEINEIDYIIISTKHKGIDNQYSIGSLAGALLQKTNKPLILVPPQFKGDAPHTILFTFKHLEEEAPSVLAPLSRLQQICKAQIEVLKVKSDQPAVNESEIQNVLQVAKSTSVNAENVAQPSMQYLETKPVDLVSMIIRKRGFFEKLIKSGRITKEELKIEVPLLLLPETKLD